MAINYFTINYQPKHIPKLTLTHMAINYFTINH